jgi:hypothetical protein
MDLRIDATVRRRLTLLLAATLLAAGWASLLLGRFDSGVRLETRGPSLVGITPRVVVSDVIPGSIAAQYGVQVGMVVTQLQGVTLIEVPSYIENDPAMPSPDPDTGEIPPYTPTIEPAQPRQIEVDPVLLERLVSEPVTRLAAVEPSQLEQTRYEAAVEG